MKRLLGCWLSLGIAIGAGGSASGNALATETRRSSTLEMSSANQALQRDDTQNPAMLWVKDGDRFWLIAPSAGQKSCASCHGDAAKSMRGVAARYPAITPHGNQPLNLQQRINVCRVKQQGEALPSLDDPVSLALEAYVARQSRGLPIAPPNDARLREWQQRGEKLFNTRFGQVDLSCAQCHQQYAGKQLASTVIPQGHPTGYPLYRLEWQAVGSLQRRLRNCMVAVRAEPFAANSDEFAALEAYLAQRAAGMLMESPAVRP